MRRDDSGQMHTMEGVIAALMMVLAMSFIISSITLVSPQTEKTTSVKLTIKAQDTLTVLGTVDQPANASSVLLRDIALWKGAPATDTTVIGPGEASISSLYDTLYGMLPENVFFNVNLTYFNDATSKMETKRLIYMGDPVGSAASASKSIIVNDCDIDPTQSPSQYWKGMDMPKVAEVRLILWSI